MTAKSGKILSKARQHLTYSAKVKSPLKCMDRAEVYQISGARVTVAVPSGRSNMVTSCRQFKFDGQQCFENGHLTRDTSQIYSLTYF